MRRSNKVSRLILGWIAVPVERMAERRRTNNPNGRQPPSRPVTHRTCQDVAVATKVIGSQRHFAFSDSEGHLFSSIFCTSNSTHEQGPTFVWITKLAKAQNFKTNAGKKGGKSGQPSQVSTAQDAHPVDNVHSRQSSLSRSCPADKNNFQKILLK